MRLANLALATIDPPPNDHRPDPDQAHIEDLAASIAQVGLINPITVIPKLDRFELKAGKCRLLAHELLGRTHIPAIVRDTDDPTTGSGITFAENLQRSNLSPVEEALAIQEELTTHRHTIEQLARLLNRSEDWIRTRLDLLKLPPAMQGHVHRRELALVTALTLARVTDVTHRDYLLRYALHAGASHQVVREWVKQWEIHNETQSTDPLAAPPWPADGGPVVVHAPCFACGEPHEATRMAIVRLCGACTKIVSNANASQQTPT